MNVEVPVLSDIPDERTLAVKNAMQNDDEANFLLAAIKIDGRRRKMIYQM